MEEVEEEEEEEEDKKKTREYDMMTDSLKYRLYYCYTNIILYLSGWHIYSQKNS